MRARNEYQRIAESYNKVLSEGAPVGAAEHLRAGAAEREEVCASLLI